MLTHHAYYIEGPLASFEEYKATLKPFWARTFERFGIDEARALIELASLKNIANPIFLIGASSITSEAQQALLKLFEEPQPGTVFVLLVPHGSIIPTLRSRMLELSQETASQKVLGSASPQPDYFVRQSLAFLQASGKERSDIVAALLKDEEGTKDRVRGFLDALELELYNHIDKPPVRQGLEDIAMVRDYVRDRSPSLKMLLEHLALCLPKS